MEGVFIVLLYFACVALYMNLSSPKCKKCGYEQKLTKNGYWYCPNQKYH